MLTFLIIDERFRVVLVIAGDSWEKKGLNHYEIWASVFFVSRWVTGSFIQLASGNKDTVLCFKTDINVHYEIQEW